MKLKIELELELNEYNHNRLLKNQGEAKTNEIYLREISNEIKRVTWIKNIVSAEVISIL